MEFYNPEKKQITIEVEKFEPLAEKIVHYLIWGNNDELDPKNKKTYDKSRNNRPER